jgi:parvulin-like peptidyl-prolyl isomerase
MARICLRPILRLFVAIFLLGVGACLAQSPAPKAPAASPSPAANPPTAASVPTEPKLQTAEPSSKVVLKVGDQQFTKADMDFLIENLPPQTQQAIATRGKKSLGDQYALIVMLSHQAHLQHLDETPTFAQKLAFQKQQLEAQTAVDEINQQVKLTPEEIQQYYTAHAADYDEVLVRQIVVRKKAPEPKPDAEHPTSPQSSTVPGFAPEDAKTRAEAIRKELAAGTDVKAIMGESKPGDVIIDAEPRKVRRGAMRPDMEKVAFALKDGEISNPVEVPQALVLFQVTGHSHLDLKDATPELEKSLRQQKFDAALAQVKKTSTVWMDDQYFTGPPRPPDRPTLGPPAETIPPKP